MRIFVSPDYDDEGFFYLVTPSEIDTVDEAEGCRSTRGTSRRIPHAFRIGGAQLAVECLEAA